MTQDGLIIQKPTFNTDLFEEGDGVLFQKKGDPEPRVGIIKEINPLLIVILAWDLNADAEHRGRGKRKVANITLMAQELMDNTARIKYLDPKQIGFD